ncbi:hypothetical protein [Qipengyuania sediminis]|uniref:hypothetical protein n=1 Tax=Qipengyuania sediminis TaxID=1532023 RepID=UPI0010599D5C|nr:hypothetical protein [Qipengyuania sediminis]
MEPLATRVAAALALTFAIAACVPKPRPPAPAPAAPRLRPQPAPTPAIVRNWLDAPQTAGNWFYRAEGPASLALFGGDATEADFIIRCDRSARAIFLMHASQSSGPATMRIRTETAERDLGARSTGDALPYLTATLQPDDRLLDAMALSKGRFAVEVAGSPTLYLPSWAEVTRVIEDCR